ncbi:MULTISPECIES: hypothetical protein [unclassified Psychrobacter]|uniref:hypothetical protein n=1 Tax=unclassified Psychrobacter TaxID=196806 RepID=UPI003F4650A9
MRAIFHLKTLTVAVAALSIASVASAAGLDRSGQDITAFLQDGTYAETVYTYINADVTGYDNAVVRSNDESYVQGRKIDDIAESYDFFRYGVKTDINDTFSIGVLYDEPFGAAALYSGDNNFVSIDDADTIVAGGSGGDIPNVATLNGAIAQAKGALANPNIPDAAKPDIAEGLAQLEILKGAADAAGEATNVEVRSHSLTGILGMKLGQNKNFQVYGGPVAQRIEANVKLRGAAYGPASGYTANINPSQDYGWLAGASYSKPEIALKAALTYRSEIDHKTQIGESFDVGVGNSIEITTPKSVNLDFQTGVNPTTLATAKVRWVPWDDFAITPPNYNEVSKTLTGDDKGLDLVSYDDEQWVVELGLAKRLTPALAVSGTVGWDSGAGDPVTSLGPIEGYYSAGLGAKYNVTENWAVSAGGKYLWFGDAKGKTPTQDIVSNFEDNDGYVLGVKVSYQAQ